MHDGLGCVSGVTYVRINITLRNGERNPHAAQMLERFQRRTKQDVDAARKNVLAATAELARVRASEGLAVGQNTGAAFDADVNRRRMSPTPPRTVPVSTTRSEYILAH